MNGDLQGPLATAWRARARRSVVGGFTHLSIVTDMPEMAALWGEEGAAASHDNAHWTGGTPEELTRMFQVGNLACVEGARKLVERLSKRIKLPTPAASVSRPTVAGGRVHVPSYLAGIPTQFRRNDVPSPNQVAPVRVFAAIGASAGIDSTQLDLRGQAIAAFAMMLSRQRPVELYAYEYSSINGGMSHNAVIATRLGLTPVDWPRICTAFNSNFYRRAGFLSFFALSNQSSQVNWGKHSRQGEVTPLLREVLGCKPSDIVVGGMHISDGNDAESWIEGMLKKAA